MKKFIRLYAVVIFSLPLILCEKPATRIPADKSTIHLDQEDEELAHITQHARDTLPVFFRHLLRPAKEEGNFRVKYPFRADRDSGFGMEQLWLSDIRYKDGVYYGVVANTPFYISSIQKGDTVTFSAEDITDWMYTSGEKIIGGYSIKYLLDMLPEHSEEQQHIMKMLPEPPAPAFDD
jgi:uncharacterized protein YegJ (DUF2314 family)